MNEPIISPWLIYWISRLDVVQTIAIVTTATCLGATVVSALELICSNKEEKKVFMRGIMYKAVRVFAVAVLILVLVPNKEEALAIYVASKVTPASIQVVGESADKAADKVVEKIIRIIDATKEEKK